MRKTRVLVVFGTTLALLATVLAGAAWAPWRNANILNYDVGQVCTNGIDLSFASVSPAYTTKVENRTTSATIANRATSLAFGPVPELFGSIQSFDYSYFGAHRVLFSPAAQPGDILFVTVSGTSTGDSFFEETVRDCALSPPFLGFGGLKELPRVNDAAKASSENGKIRLTFRLPGDRGLDIFVQDEGRATAGPFYAAVNCSTLEPTPTSDTSIQATGSLRYRTDTGRYIYKWGPPPNLVGCYEVWFRVVSDGLTHRVLFDFGS